MVLAQIWFKLVAKTIVDTFYDTSYTDKYFHYCISNTIVSNLIIRRVRTENSENEIKTIRGFTGQPKSRNWATATATMQHAADIGISLSLSYSLRYPM